MTAPRVRCLRRVVITADWHGAIDDDLARRACDSVRPGDDVVLIVRGRVGVEPGSAALIGRCLAEARTIDVHAAGPCAALFARAVRQGALDEAAS